jgi:4-hydroxybenzoate polyprenyltransferase
VEDLLRLTPLAVAVLLFFFKLRLFDEIKDIESDAVHHPERPLPRGVLRMKDIQIAILLIIIVEILLFSLYGAWALAGVVMAIGYSLVMFKEFFVREWLRSHITTYAITHTFVVFFISTSIFTALFGTPLISQNVTSYSLAGWFLFNIFEFGRKTFARQEEKKGINSYSKTYGRFGAVLLVVAMAVASIVLLSRIVGSSEVYFLSVGTGIVGIMGFLSAILDQPRSAKVYRFATSLYIIFAYGTVGITLFSKM